MNAMAKAHTELMANSVDTVLLDRYIAFLDKRPKTVETYTKALRQFAKYMAAQEISRPTREDVIAFRKSLEASGHKPGTIQTYIISLKQFFKWTETERIYPNITVNVKGAKIENDYKKDPLTSNQARELMAGIDRSTLIGARDYAILALMLTGGLRTIEIVRADIEDLRPLGDETVLYVQGKGHDQKSVYVKVPPPTEQAIREYLKLRGKASGKAPLFASASRHNMGERMTTRSISRIVKESMRAIGLDNDRLTAHSLRHTAGTLNLLNGATIDETQMLLRHAKIDTTLRYAHHLDRAKSQSEYRLASVLFGN